MAAHSRILAWKIPWTEEPRGLQLMDCKTQARFRNTVAAPPHAFLITAPRRRCLLAHFQRGRVYAIALFSVSNLV